jgi:uncharacterized membrane protein
MKGLQFLCLILVGSLFALTGLRQFFAAPLAGSGVNLLWFVVQVLPLLLVLPGILRLKVRSFFFAAMAGMLYFVHGILQAATPQLRAMGLWEVGFAMALVLAATYGTRQLRGRSDLNE